MLLARQPTGLYLDGFAPGGSILLDVANGDVIEPLPQFEASFWQDNDTLHGRIIVPSSATRADSLSSTRTHTRLRYDGCRE
jgi:hypothetical protein